MFGSQVQQRTTGASGKAAVVGVCALLATAVFVVFGQTLRYDFVNYDDDVYFYSNAQVQAGLTGHSVAWAFTTDYNGNWHPLTWLSFMLDAEVFGNDPAGPHLTNVLLHAANTVLLFLLLRRLTGALWRSALVAALFGLHPLHVESVAWVSERKDVLSGLFFMLTLLCYARWVTGDRPSPKGFGPAGNRPVTGNDAQNASRFTRYASRFYWLAVLFSALGLMCKPMLVTVPFVLLLLDYWPLQRLNRPTRPRLLLEKLPFFLLSLSLCGVTLHAQVHNAMWIEKIPLAARIYNAVTTCFVYLEKMVCPTRLTVFYPYTAAGVPALKTGSGFMLLAGIGLGFFFWRRQRPHLLAGWLWYLGMLVPVMGLVQISRHMRADRYTYLPLIGVFILLVWETGQWFPDWRHRRRMFGVVAATVMAVLMTCAARQTSYWRNSESLWTHALACTTGNYIAHNNLGLALAAQGRTAEALQHFQKAVEINPSFVEAHNNLGVFLGQQGRPAEAIGHFQKAIQLQLDCADAYNDLGNVLADQGHLAEAIYNYQKAVEFRPDFMAAHFNLGNALALQGRYAEAIRHFQRVLQLRPDDVKAQQSLAAAIDRQRQSADKAEKPLFP